MLTKITYNSIMSDWQPERIRSLRDEVGFSQKLFGELLGVSRVHIYLLEKGTKKPSTTLCKLLDYIEKDKRVRNQEMNNKVMTINDKVSNVFNKCTKRELTRKDIIKSVMAQYTDLKNQDSIIPSDHCYNRMNVDTKFGYILFEHTERDTYIVLGKDYPYYGDIYWNKMGENPRKVGVWEKGGLRLTDNEFIKACKNLKNRREV